MQNQLFNSDKLKTTMYLTTHDPQNNEDATISFGFNSKMENRISEVQNYK
jgi:hypothetical protein